MTSASTAPAAGGLLWAFHTGFAEYIARLDDGRITVEDGATAQPDGRVFFPTAPTPPAAASDRAADTPAVLWSGLGTLQFTGHHGMLAVTLSSPAVLLADGRYLLTVDDPFEPGQRMPLADLGPTGLPNSQPDTLPTPLHVAEPRLTEEGADLFFGHYHWGTPLAPMELAPTAAPTAAPSTPEA